MRAVFLALLLAVVAAARAARADDVVVGSTQIEYQSAPGTRHVGFVPRLEHIAGHVDKVVRPLRYLTQSIDILTSARNIGLGGREVNPIFKPFAKESIFGYAFVYAALDALGDLITRRSAGGRLTTDATLMVMGIHGGTVNQTEYVRWKAQGQ